jgi:hypothetical protein
MSAQPVIRVPRARQQPRPTAIGPATPPAQLWTHDETAAYLRIPAATLHQLNYKGTGPRSYKVGRYRRYDPSDVASWLAARASDAG